MGDDDQDHDKHDCQRLSRSDAQVRTTTIHHILIRTVSWRFALTAQFWWRRVRLVLVVALVLFITRDEVPVILSFCSMHRESFDAVRCPVINAASSQLTSVSGVVYSVVIGRETDRQMGRVSRVESNRVIAKESEA